MRDAPLSAIELQVKTYLAQRSYVVTYTGLHDASVICIKAYLFPRVAIDDVKQLPFEYDDPYPSSPFC